MSTPLYESVASALLQARPQSNPQTIIAILEAIREPLAQEAIEIIKEGEAGSIDEIWQAVRYSPSVENKMRSLLAKIGRMHVLYVLSRFKNSPAIGPPLIYAILQEELKRLKGKDETLAKSIKSIVGG